VNERGVSIVTRARGLIAPIPGAESIQCNDSRTWTIVTIGCATGDTVHALALLFGLGPVQERRAELPGGGYRWYLRAGSERRERGRGTMRLDVIGPAQIEPPPGESSS